MASPFPYLPFFDPSCLRRLHLESESMVDIHYFLADILAMASFRDLHVLEPRIDGLGTSMAALHVCISAFPAVEDLTLYIIRCQMGPVPSTPLAPQLRAYKSSMCFLPVVLVDLQKQRSTDPGPHRR
ncbi:hypothetical protein K438DRAFT_1976249 [Mycena galopus ATCC 62051]|nr:hypothetical protein K438DRAFT_1976249 [Mycena galopus ATCC 62051]